VNSQVSFTGNTAGSVGGKPADGSMPPGPALRRSIGASFDLVMATSAAGLLPAALASARVTHFVATDPPRRPSRAGRGDEAHPPSRSVRALSDDDALDPRKRHLASIAPPDACFQVLVPAFAQCGGPVGSEVVIRAPPSLEHLIPALVRRLALSGDGRRGTARLEIGGGELAGATLLVHADGGRVRVHLDVPAGVDAQSWQRRISERLASRNIATDAVEVT